MRYVMLATLLLSGFAWADSLKPITIALLLPITGGIADQAAYIKNGASLAFNKAKAEFRTKGFDLKLKVFDDKTDPLEGKTQAELILADKNILAVLGAINSGVTIPTSEIFARDNLVMLSPKSTNPKVTDRGLPNINRIVARDDAQAPAAAEFATQQLQAKSVFIFDDGTTYGKGLAQLFKQSLPTSLRVMGQISSSETKNFSSVVAQIKTLNPELVYFAADYDQVIPIIKLIRAEGIQSTFMGADALDTPALAKQAGSSAAGLLYTNVSAPASAYPKAKSFITSYRAIYRSEPDGNAVLGFDAMNVILQSLSSAISSNNNTLPSRKLMSTTLRNINVNDSISGEIGFNSFGDRKKASIFVLRIGDDLITRVGSVINVTPKVP
jgi:branched-chain amino acid transport system substrate-binding protein